MFIKFKDCLQTQVGLFPKYVLPHKSLVFLHIENCLMIQISFVIIDRLNLD